MTVIAQKAEKGEMEVYRSKILICEMVYITRRYTVVS